MKTGPKDQASIPSGPPHRAHNDTTTMQYETKKNTNTHKHKITGDFDDNSTCEMITHTNTTST